MRTIVTRIVRILAALFVIASFSAALPISTAAPKAQTDITESVPPTAPVHETPMMVIDDIPSQRIAVSDTYTCAIDDNNKVWCWGSNASGNLGFGYASDEIFPERKVILGLKATSISITSDGRTCVTDDAGGVQCWGITRSNRDDADKDNVPVEKHAGLPTDKKFKRAGYGCFVDSDDLLWCEEQEGIAKRMGDIKFQSGGGSSSNGCAVSLDHSLYCWETGNNSSIPLDHPSDTPTKVEGITAALLTTGRGTNCVVETNGTPHCWGINNLGQTGEDAKTGKSVDLSKLKVTSMDTTSRHTCVVDDRQVPWCWGGYYGGIVDGNKPLRGFGIPANYRNIENFKAVTVATAPGRTCFVDTEGAFWCWGRNENGELGNGTTTDSAVPVKVEGLTVALTP